MKKIVFTNITDHIFDLPKPASKYLPTWYKDMESYIGGEKKPDGKGLTTATIKKCIPVLDSITAGYIIESPADVYVSRVNGETIFEWASLDLIKFHSIEQAPNHPNRKSNSYPKWTNIWGITTPKGYSTLFIQPMHRDSVFTIFPGIVDTDTYTSPINFPFVINDPEFEGLIPKGTPIAQVIPFKRDSWKSVLGSKKDVIKQNYCTKKLQTVFFNAYKSMFWSKKEYL
jgi:hypothetical protein